MRKDLKETVKKKKMTRALIKQMKEKI